jgi:hypothetical protein
LNHRSRFDGEYGVANHVGQVGEDVEIVAGPGGVRIDLTLQLDNRAIAEIWAIYGGDNVAAIAAVDTGISATRATIATVAPTIGVTIAVGATGIPIATRVGVAVAVAVAVAVTVASHGILSVVIAAADGCA